MRNALAILNGAPILKPTDVAAIHARLYRVLEQLERTASKEHMAKTPRRVLAEGRAAVPAVARIVRVPPALGRGDHFELEWQGSAGIARSGIRYESADAAGQMATACGASAVA